MSDDERVPRRSFLQIMSTVATDAFAEGIIAADQADRQAKADAARLRAPVDKSRIKQAIAHYEVLHKQDRKITLKGICEQFGVNYGSTRALKSRYAKQKRKRKKS